MSEIVPVLTIFSFGMVVGLMVCAIGRNLRSMVVWTLVALCLVFGLWSLGAYNAMTQVRLAHRVLWYQISAFGWSFYPMAFLGFILEITGLATSKRRWLLVAATGGLGACFCMAILLDSRLFIGRFLRTAWGWAMTKPADSPVMLACFAYMIASGVLILVLLARWGLQTSFRQKRKQAAMLFVAGLILFGGSFVTDILLPAMDIPMLPLTPCFSIVMFIAIFRSVYGYHMLELDPVVTVGEVMLRIRDLMLLLDRDGHVLQMNATARGVLGYAISDPLRFPAERILPGLVLPSGDAPVECDTEMVNAGHVRIPVQLAVHPRYNADGDLLGYIVIATDMRARLENERQRMELQRTEARQQDQSQLYRHVLARSRLGFMQMGADQRILPGHCSACSALFGVETMEGLDFTDVVLAPWEPGERAQVRAMIDNLFREQRGWKVEALLKLLPASVTVAGRLLSLQYEFPESAAHAGARTLLEILEDRTDAMLQESKLGVENQRLSMIVNILLHRSAFLEFLDEYRTWYAMQQKSVQAGLKTPLEQIQDMYRNIHTFKGGFLRYGMRLSANRLMQYENLLTSLIARVPSQEDLGMAMVQCEPEAWIAEDLETLRSAAGTDFLDARARVEIDRADLERIVADLEERSRWGGTDSDALRGMLYRFRELYSIRAKRLLLEYGPYVSMISRERGLPEPVFAVQGTDALLDGTLFRPFFRVLVHVFNNIVAHAIESPEERRAMAKPERARIECHVDVRHGNLMLEIADDGRGIDPARIRETARLRAGKPGAESGGTGASASGSIRLPDDQEIIQHIFEPGYSTAMMADTLSGRGIGLFAVAHAAEALGGSVRVQSKTGAFTRFCFVLPMGSLAQERRDSWSL